MGKKKSTTTNKPWKEAQPYILGAAGEVKNAYDGSMGNVRDASNQLSGLLPGLIDRFNQGDAGVNAARDYNTGVLGGQYLDAGNPYLQQMIDQSGNDVMNSMQADMSLKGLTGGSDYAGLIASQLGKNSLGMRYADYSSERDRMANAAAQSPGIAAADYNALNPAFAAGNASMMPMQAASGYAGSLGGLFGGYGSQTSPGGWGTDLLGAGAQIGSAAIMASERKVKRDIEQIGAEPDGLGVYRYNYIWDAADEPRRTGVMVDEVETIRPWALGPVVDGIQTVDYSKLGAR